MMDEVVIELATSGAAQAEAAGIWALATDARDSRTVPSDPSDKLAGIQRRLASSGATLHVARRGAAAEGFVLLVPCNSDVELVYLAVDPAAWGRGTGSSLLAYVVAYAEARDHESIVLWVLANNGRAIATYLRAGWVLTSNTTSDGERSERQMVLALSSGV